MVKKVDNQFKRLTEKLTNLEQIVSVLSQSQLNHKIDEKTWNIIQVIQHLILAEGGTYRYISKKILDPSKLQTVTFRTKIREIKLNSYIKTPIKWPAPKIVQPQQYELPEDIDTLLNEWKKIRKDLFELLNSLDADMWNKEIHKHPLVGRISLKGSLNFIEFHFDRHQKQIEKLLPKVIN
jgi:protein tyrosine phosphatase